MEAKPIFVNERGVIRSGWRFILFAIATFCFASIIGLLLIFLLSLSPLGFDRKGVRGLLVGMIATLAGALFSGWFCGRIFERLPLKALGCSLNITAVTNFALGIVVGTIAISFAALIGVLFGGLSFQRNSSHGQSAILLTLGISFVVFLIGAAMEEVLARGYMLQTFFRAGLAPFAVVFTSAIFALLHARNPSVTYFSLANTFIAGIWFCVAYYKTRSLWLPIGLHFSWNWVQGSILGMNVSGIKEISEAPLMNAIDTGPTWLTGGHYGIEGGAACTIALLVSTAVIAFLPVGKMDKELLALTSKPESKQLES